MRFFKYSEKPEEEKTGTQTNASETPEGFGNFWAKVVCIIAAILVWFYVSGDKSVTYEKEFNNITIEYTNMNALKEQGFEIINGGNFTADISLSGVRRDINSIKDEDIVASVDLSGIYSSGEHSVKVAVKAPNKAAVSNIFPTEIKLHIDKSSTELVNLAMKPQNVSTTDSQTTVNYVFSANEINITGPKNEIDRVDHAIVEHNFSGERLYHGYKIENAKIKLVDVNNAEISSPYITIKPSETDVTVNLTKSATVKIKPSYAGNFDYERAGYSQTVEPAEVKIRGIPEIINGITELGTSTINSEAIGTESEYSTTVELVLPNGVQLKDDTVNEVRVTLKREIENKKLDINNIVFINIPDGFEAFAETENIEIEIFGTVGDIEKLNADNVYLVANLSGLSKAGKHKDIPLRAEIDESSIPNSESVSVSGEYKCTVVLRHTGEVSSNNTVE